MHLIRSLAVSLCAGAVAVAASGSDPSTWLSQARAAMGGEVAAETITSLRIRASLRRTVGARPTDSSWTLSWQAPDKFVIEEVQGMDMGPMGTLSVTRRNGFNGDQRIHEMRSDIPLPPPPASPLPDAEIVFRQKHMLARVLAALLASPGVIPGTFALSDSASTPALFSPPGSHVVTMRDDGGHTLRLALDGQTWLPAMVSWIGRPIVSFSTTGTAVVSSRGDVIRATPPITLPSGDPTAGMSDVEYRMALTEYKLDKGVQWPRRITTTIADQPYEVLRVNRYEVNPTINPRTFAVRR
jgi:hypothetical protein